jgi:hypothetical protein
MDLSSIQFKEVNANDLKYVDPAIRAAQQGMQAALGSEYAGETRRRFMSTVESWVWCCVVPGCQVSKCLQIRPCAAAIVCHAVERGASLIAVATDVCAVVPHPRVMNVA